MADNKLKGRRKKERKERCSSPQVISHGEDCGNPKIVLVLHDCGATNLGLHLYSRKERDSGPSQEASSTLIGTIRFVADRD